MINIVAEETYHFSRRVQDGSALTKRAYGIMGLLSSKDFKIL